MKSTRAMARIAALAGVATLALVVPLTATASAPEPVRIETDGFFTGPDSTAGTFTASWRTRAPMRTRSASRATPCTW